MVAKQSKKNFLRRHPQAVRTTLIAGCFVASFLIGFAYASWAMVCRGGRCPSVDLLAAYVPSQTSKLYAADGRFLAELGLERRTLVRIADIPPVVKQAFITSEDHRFYQHSGVDWLRVPSAIKADIKTRTW